jgi:glycosyltransferase 2 family protein
MRRPQSRDRDIAVHSMLKKVALIVVKVVVTVGIFWILLSHVDVKSVAATMRAIPFAASAAAALLVLAQPLIAALRWHFIMRFLGASVRLPQTLRVFWIGQFATTLLPGAMAGDGARMWVMARSGMRASKSIDSVLLDRIAALAGLTLLVAAILPFVGDVIAPASLRYAGAVVLAAGTMVGFIAGVCLRLPASSQNFRAGRAFAYLLDDLRAICSPPWRLAGLVGLSAFAVALNGLTVFVLVRSLGVQIRLSDCLALMPVVILVTTLPISLGGWGLREGSMVGLLSIVGVPPAVSFSVSIVLGLLATVISAPGALIWLQTWQAAKSPSTRRSSEEPPYAPASEAQT